jgi:hypothetical protein
MTISKRGPLSRKWTLRALIGSLLLFLLAGPVTADVLTPFTGYTRPGVPSDRVVEGKVIFVGMEKEGVDGLGGTVYFTVLELTRRAEGDPWGANVKGFSDMFVPGGRDAIGAGFAPNDPRWVSGFRNSSPALDTSAQFLYLYQTVNDRHTVEAVRSTSVRLLVDPRLITSWGYFRDLGFATAGRVLAKGKEVPVDFTPDEAAEIVPVAANVDIADHVVNKMYLEHAPAIPAKRAFNVVTIKGRRAPGFTIGGGIKTPEFNRDVPGPGGVVGVGAEKDAAAPAARPDSVVLLPPNELLQRPCFRANWVGANVLKPGERSCIFGFTSNEPPTIEPVRLRGVAAKVTEKGDIVYVGADRDEMAVGAGGDVAGASLTAAEGDVPTPVGFEAGGPSVSGLGLVGGQSAGAGGAMGGAPGFGAAFGHAAPAAGFGGGSGGGFGSSGGNQGQSNGQTQVPSQVQNVNVFQQQQQQQQQSQTNTNNGNCCPVTPPEVVPEPAAIVMALIGLPFLALLRRKKTAPTEPVP